MAMQASPKATLDCVDAFGRTDLRPDMDAFNVPTLVVHGLEDVMVHPSGGRATAAAVPDAELLLVPGMGHDLPPALFGELADAIRRTADRAPNRR